MVDYELQEIGRAARMSIRFLKTETIPVVMKGKE